MNMKNLFSLLIVIFASYYLYSSLQFPFLKEGRPDSGFLPIIIAIALILLSIFDFAKGFKENKRDKMDQTYIKEFLIIVLVIGGYIAGFVYLGALLSTIVFTFVVLAVINKKRNVQNILISLICPVLIYSFFEFFLETNIPPGLLERFL